MKRIRFLIVTSLTLLFIAGMTHAGDLERPAGDPKPSMPSLQQISDRIDQIIPSKFAPPAKPSYPPDSEFAINRFTNNGDGTITDNMTRLVWEDRTSSGTWAQALSYCNSRESGSAGLSDGSVAGDWRLPNINELYSLYGSGSSLANGICWSSTTFQGVSSSTQQIMVVNAYIIYFSTGQTGIEQKYDRVDRNYNTISHRAVRDLKE